MFWSRIKTGGLMRVLFVFLFSFFFLGSVFAPSTISTTRLSVTKQIGPSLHNPAPLSWVQTEKEGDFFDQIFFFFSLLLLLTSFFEPAQLRWFLFGPTPLAMRGISLPLTRGPPKFKA